MTGALRRGSLRGTALLAGLAGYGFSIAMLVGPLVQFFVSITPKRVLALRGWASIAQASDLGVRSHGERITVSATEHAEIASLR